MGATHSHGSNDEYSSESSQTSPRSPRSSSEADTPFSGTSLAHKSISRLLSPRGDIRKKLGRECSFVDLPEISLSQIKLNDNIGWGATGM